MNTMLNKSDITQALLKEYLDYDPKTGYLTWLKKPSKRSNINERAGSLVPKTGYRSITLFGKSYAEHHIIWFWIHGHWATMLDHINQIRDDNRAVNLREVTVAENAQNRRRRVETKVNEAGIWYNKRRHRYVAEITVKGKKVFQRLFVDVEDAITARRAKLKELGFGINHGS